MCFIIDREAREIIYLVASVCPSVKSIKSNYQSKVFVGVSIISGRMWIIAWMQSIGF